MKPPIIYLDGKLVQADTALLHALTPGVVEGRGVFESMAIYDGKIFALNEHFERMQRGVKAFHLLKIYRKKNLIENLNKVIKQNHIKRGRIRIALWKDQRFRTAIVGQNVKPITEQKYKHGFSGVISTVKRKQTQWSHLKTIDYALFREALEQAKSKGADEAILLNKKNELVEGSVSNIFFFKKGLLCTPSVKSGCLNGITRHFVITLARQLGMKVKMGRYNVRDLATSSEAFLTSSFMEVMPLTNLNGKPIADGRAGNNSLNILNAYRILVKKALK